MVGGSLDGLGRTRADVLRGRIQASKNANPQHKYSATDRFNSYAETGVYFQTLMDATKNAVPLNYLKILFGMWKFPLI
jgi:hypothetical protein